MFVDDDFLWLGDIADLLDYCDDKYALICVKHDYKPSVTTKLAGREQLRAPGHRTIAAPVDDGILHGRPARRC